MRQLPYIDEHAITVDAYRETTWPAVLRVMCHNSEDPATVPFGFRLEEATPPRRLSLKGRHLFAAYRLAFELDPDSAGTRVRAVTWADFAVGTAVIPVAAELAPDTIPDPQLVLSVNS